LGTVESSLVTGGMVMQTLTELPLRTLMARTLLTDSLLGNTSIAHFESHYEVSKPRGILWKALAWFTQEKMLHYHSRIANHVETVTEQDRDLKTQSEKEHETQRKPEMKLRPEFKP
jgi:hypothetical protein